MLPVQRASSSRPVNGSEKALKKASKAFMKPIAVAASVTEWISLIMVKDNMRELIAKPKRNNRQYVRIELMFGM